jgi:transcriptional regulator
MYTPVAFRIDDRRKIARLIKQNSFGTLVTHDGQSSVATHLPFLFHDRDGEHGILVGHMARANPQWRHFRSEQEVLVIFQGPHAYISPAWYQTPVEVPTWNYAAVHVYGTPALIEDHQRLGALLEDTIATYEAEQAQPWAGDLPNEFRDQQMKGIVGFEIPIARIEGKFKLGQNRSPEDLRGVYARLSKSIHAGDRALAALMLDESLVRNNAAE